MTGVDTNVVLRYLLRDEPAQAARAARELERDERVLIGRRNRAAGAGETVTFDKGLRGLEGFRLL